MVATVEKVTEQWDGRPVPMDRWGKDHWSTLAYVETRCVDHKGILSRDHMRPHPDRPGIFLGHRQLLSKLRRGNYPTMLTEDVLLDGHDDWNCVEDMIAEGLLTVQRPPDIMPYGKGLPLSGLQETEVRVRGRYHLTKKGLALCAKIRAHKANGGNFRTFTP